MPIEIHAVGVACNLSCPYCYEHPMRDAGNFDTDEDFERIKAGINGYDPDQHFIMFGGEPLLMPLDKLEQYFKFGFERSGRNGIQTNGALITDAHIELFKKYRVGVGISVDGPDELNDSRWAGSLEKTREATRKTDEAITKLCEAGIPPGLIVTLHRGNATAEHLPRMKKWFVELSNRGVRSARLHQLELDNNVESSMSLTPQEGAEALLSISQLQYQTNIRFDMFKDVAALMRGKDGQATCIYRNCDPWDTQAVRGVDAQGERVNCGRGTKEGINFIKANKTGFERQLALYNAPQETGGCNGCRFFLMCRGECPGTGLDGDWRNHTTNCESWKIIFSYYEHMMEQFGLEPLSKAAHRETVEYILLKGYEQGVSPTVESIIAFLEHHDQGSDEELANAFFASSNSILPKNISPFRPDGTPWSAEQYHSDGGYVHVDSHPQHHPTAPPTPPKKKIDISGLSGRQYHADNGMIHLDSNAPSDDGETIPVISKKRVGTSCGPRPNVDVTKLTPEQYHADNGSEHIDIKHQDW